MNTTERAELRADELRADAIAEMELDDQYNRHESHDERPDLEDCWLCRQAFEEAFAEHAWMARAVRSNPTNPYAPADPQAPQRDWYIDGEGFVKVDA